MKYYDLEKERFLPKNYLFVGLLYHVAYFLTVQAATIHFQQQLQNGTLQNLQPLPFFNLWLYLGIVTECHIFCRALFTVNECGKRTVPLILKYQTLPVTSKQYYQVRICILAKNLFFFLGINVLLYAFSYLTALLPVYLFIHAIVPILLGVLYTVLIMALFLIFYLCRDYIWLYREHT